MDFSGLFCKGISQQGWLWNKSLKQTLSARIGSIQWLKSWNLAMEMKQVFSKEC